MVVQRVFCPWIALSLPVGNVAHVLPLSVQDKWCHSLDDRRHGRRASGYPPYWARSGSILVAIEVAASGTLSRLCFPRDVTDCGACLRARPHDMARLLAVGGLCISASGSRVPMLGRQTTYVVDICDWKDRPVVEGRVVAKVTKAGVSCIRFASSD